MIPYAIVDIELSNITHHSEGCVQIEYEGVLTHCLFELVCLNGASYVREGESLDLLNLGWIRLPPVFFRKNPDLLEKFEK